MEKYIMLQKLRTIDIVKQFLTRQNLINCCLPFFLLAGWVCSWNRLDAQAPDWIWAKSFGETEFVNNSRCITTDPETDDVYTTGTFAGLMDFNPPGNFWLSSVGKKDLFISKLNSSGGFVWAFSLGAPGSTIEGYSILIDTAGSGSIFVAGDYDGTVDFNPGSGLFNLTSIGGSDVFIAKYTLTGNLIWAKSFGGTGDEICFSMALDPSRDGGIYSIGKFSGTVDFNPGGGVYNLTSAGGDEIFNSKWDADGNFQWARRLGGSLADVGLSIALDASGSIYGTGKFEGVADFDPGAGVFNLTSSGNADIFIYKLNASGNFIWARGIGGTGTDIGFSIAVDPSINGGVYTTGQFSGLVDFNPGSDTFNLSGVGDPDMFISKLNDQGDFVWAKSMVGDVVGKSITIDTSDVGYVYTTGYFNGSVDFDPGTGSFTLTAAGENDIFISKINFSGEFKWAKRVGSEGDDQANSIALGKQGNICYTGFFRDTVDFDPGPGISNLQGLGHMDMFTSNVDTAGHFLWAKKIGDIMISGAGLTAMAVDQEDGSVYLTGSFVGRVDFDPGPDTFYMTGLFYSNIYILKLNNQGLFSWVKNFGTFQVATTAIAIDPASHDVLTIGNFSGALDFDPGPGIFTLWPGDGDMFISRLDSTGNFVSAKQCGFFGYCEGATIAIEAGTRDIFITGQFYNFIDFDPGPGYYFMDSQGNYDLFILKLNSNEEFIWATAAGGPDASVFSKTMVSDTAGEGAIYISGWFHGTVDFDPGPGIFNLSENWTPFISKYDSIGNFRWAYVLAVDITSMALNDGQEGGVFTTGAFSGTVDFNPGPGIFNVTSIGNFDGYVSKLNGDGELEWVKVMAGAGSSTFGNNVSVDTFDDHSIYIGGSFTGTVDFDPGPGIFNLNAIGGSDIFICKVDSLGNFKWAKRNGGSLGEELVAMTISPNEEFHFAGDFYSPTIQFDSTTLYNSDSTGQYANIFIGKLDHCASLVTNTLDNGPGSLRDVISCVAEGATITFSLPPMSQITLTSGEIVIDKNLTLSGSGMFDLTLSGNNTSRILHLLPGKNLILKNLSLKNATSILNGGAIYSQGYMTLENMLFQNNFQAGIPKTLTASPGTLMNIIGNVNFKF
ncbi:MAG: hypothetical protein ABJB16_11945 [Saprospiraceae bacterium]